MKLLRFMAHTEAVSVRYTTYIHEESNEQAIHIAETIFQDLHHGAAEEDLIIDAYESDSDHEARDY